MPQLDRNPVTRTPAVEDVPSFEEIGPWYEQLLDLAPALMSGSVSTRVKSWEDGEFVIRVWHKFESPNSGKFRREVLRYHSRESAVVAGVVEVDRESRDETLLFQTDINPDGIGPDAKKIRNRIGDD